ncbi:MAG: hypothetical protein HQK81_15130 [Desulfovibrionaceae bacterium]|nr:hypothetical protein [Desulfovibrionaceae bacterium]MBF0515376.1 hypothetical protein [Desulfovibrionaceae bacterium]
MKPIASKKILLRRLGGLYARMDAAYAEAAARLGLDCSGCATNCCGGFFQHHTYIEWLYLAQGLAELPDDQRARFLAKAAANVEQAKAMTAQGLLPEIMCPLNEDGRCALYGHRLMICRLHGVPNILRSPRGVREFRGCHRARVRVSAGAPEQAMDRTPLYRDLAALEMALLGAKARSLPRVDLTIAEMLNHGPPAL